MQIFNVFYCRRLSDPRAVLEIPFPIKSHGFIVVDASVRHGENDSVQIRKIAVKHVE